MEKSAKYTIELAVLIPIRNINFYIDTYKAMSSVDLSDVDYGELKKLENVMINGRLKRDIDSIDNQEAMKTLGKFLITRVRHGKLNVKGGPFTLTPFTFLGSAIVADLKLHKQGPNYEFVEKVLDELAEKRIINPDLWGLRIRARCERYKHEDLAAIFLGYSISSQGTLHSIMPFPSNPVGFISVLISQVKKLLPQGLDGDQFFKC